MRNGDDIQSRKILPARVHRAFVGAQASIKLGILHTGKHFRENRARLVACRDEIVAADQRGRTNGLGWYRRYSLASELVGRQVAVTCPAIQPMQLEMLFKPRLPHKLFEG